MNRLQHGKPLNHSHFWSCLTLADDCLFFSDTDPKLYYFGIGLCSIYVALVLMILADLKFYWNLDVFQGQIEYYINLVRQNVKAIQISQRQLMTTEQRTEKLLQRSKDSRRIVLALRAAAADNNTKLFVDLTKNYITDNPSRKSSRDSLY